MVRAREDSMNDAWFYRVGDSQLGPVPMVELQRLLGTGQIGPSVALWRQGLAEWVPASQVPALMQPEGGVQFLVPTARTSGLALTAGYLGIFGFFFPPLAPVALALGIMGVRDLKRHREKNGWGRAITGIVLGGLLSLGLLVLLGVIIFKK